MNVQKSKRFADLRRLEAHEVGRPKFRLRNPMIAGQGDFVVQPIYDYYGAAAATAINRQTLFAIPVGGNYTPIGGAAFVKTAIHTNVRVAGQLENPWAMLVRSVGVYLDPEMNTLDAERFAGQVLLNFECSGKSFFQNIVGRCGGSGGTWAAFGSTGTNAAPVTVATAANGVPSPDSGYSICAPGAGRFPQIEGVVIEQGQQFDVILDPTLAAHVAAVGFTTQTAAVTATQGQLGVGIRAWVVLDGTLARGVL